MSRLILPLLLLALAACQPEIEPAPQAGERHQISVVWRVVDRPTLEATYREAGRELGERDRLEGFAGLLPDGRHVIYTLPPQRVDDSATCTLGHEILHITHGDYHQ